MKAADLTVTVDARQLDEIMYQLNTLRARIGALERGNATPLDASIVGLDDNVQWRHDTMPDGAWRRGIIVQWLQDADAWAVRDTEGFVVSVKADEKYILRAKA